MFLRNFKKSIIISFLIFFADQITKYLAFTYLAPTDTVKITSFLNLVYVENKGAAFGLFKSLGTEFFIVLSILVIVVLILMIIKDRKNQLVYSLIMGGALGNLFDRLLHGHVIDFIDLHICGYHWPAFNIADSSLSIGIFLFVLKKYKK